MKPRSRLDVEMVRRGLAETRQKAQAMILSGHVFVGGIRVDKAGAQVSDVDDVTVAGDTNPYVSRGGLKLKGAIENFGIDVSGLVCADVGASTGGFTDCLLKEGAARVYAVDVGYGLIDSRLRDDPRVVLFEKVNVRYMPPDAVPEKLDLAVVDVSFISLRLVLGPVFSLLKPGGRVVALVKPQFEVGRERVGKGGIVRDEASRLAAVREIKEFAVSLGASVAGEMESPVRGAKGNVEYLVYMLLPG